ncbi:hypothetical protein [Sulfolobus acidocaldarius]|uniref:Uncharacterized protein n=2 Tax=Sulfolobus acidocaldarius TaxID=2285 RepID=M1IW16_9CREN|nr:hypothetical protein [Sulfolobus acidocaldarius]AGE70448.1 hypothetical protein SacN8_02340 [Sulfolobus acidocaldarius N8]AGE72722.1 hypothetical protein SacRon12I_02335 [Sulfolobus acidocaldarius Ron12/I]
MVTKDYYLGAKYVILRLRESLATKLDDKTYMILEEELTKIGKRA